MRQGLTVLLLVTVLFAGGYFYNFALAVCPIPLEYRIGELDERFGLSLDEAKVAVAEATELWEVATEQNLFSYDDEAAFTINFIYDDRQELLTTEETLREGLNASEYVNEALIETHEELVAQYETLKTDYERKVTDFDRRYAEYESTVESYNQAGGAPADVYAELEAERISLAAERSGLNRLADELNELVAEINALGDRGNVLIENYNENVLRFNEEFGETREFTQGDYRGDRINIYTYKDRTELITVLAHEFGHALSLDHVDGAESVMHYLIGGQPAELTLSISDLAEFNRICGEMSLWDKIVYRLNLSQK